MNTFAGFLIERQSTKGKRFVQRKQVAEYFPKKIKEVMAWYTGMQANV